MIVIRVIGAVTNIWPRPLYILDYNVDAARGRGVITLVPNAEQAYRFANLSDAQRAYTRKSQVNPIRTDGKPNRPMTVWKVEMLTLVEAMEQDKQETRNITDKGNIYSSMPR